MLNEDSEKLKKLISAFKSAEERVESVLLETNADNIKDLRLQVDKKLDKVNVELIKESISWAKADLPKAYKEGEAKVNGSISRRLQIEDTSVESSYISLSANVQHATEHAKDIISSAINEAESKFSYGATVGNVKDIIQNTLADENGSMTVIYNNGAKMPLSSYAEMLARTSRIESSNTGSFDRCKQLGIDLVRCTTVPGCCAYCYKYEGKVYSLSGNDSRFPSLYDTALAKGYNIMHPNCRHEFLPFVEEMQSPEQLQKLIQESNTFKDFNPKDEKLFHLYNHNQALQRQWIQEYKEYNQAKALYGKDFPYTTLGGFRRASRSGSSQYEIIHKRNIDNNQYERWKETLGEKNMPNSLAEFQELKYNEKKRFDLLRQYKETVEDGGVTNIGFDKYTQTLKVAENKIVGIDTELGKIKGITKHLVDRIIGSDEEKRKGVTIEQVVDTLKNGVSNGVRVNEKGQRSVGIVKDGVFVSVNPDTLVVIQCRPQRSKKKDNGK